MATKTTTRRKAAAKAPPQETPAAAGTEPTVSSISGVSRSAAELQTLQRRRAVVLKSRIMQSNRLQAVVAGSIGYEARMAEADRKKKFAEADRIIKGVDDGTVADTPMIDVIRVTLEGVRAFDRLKDELEREMKKLARSLPAAAWVAGRERRGFGLLFLAIVVGECGDLANYASAPKLWRRMGCAPWSFDGRTLMGATWRSGKEGKLPASEWEAYGYSPRRRSIAFLIGEGIVKQNFLTQPGADEPAREAMESLSAPGPYRAAYEAEKAKAKLRHPDWPDLRLHRHGMLVATKKLLEDLWRYWRKQG